MKISLRFFQLILLIVMVQEASRAAVTLTAVATDVRCYGSADGTINLTVNAGTPPFFYTWNNGALTEDRAGLAPGTYSVTVTDNMGASASTSLIINQPAPINLSKSITTVFCGGGNTGAVDLSAGGGTSPYTYLWSNGATGQDIFNLTAMVYYVTVTDFKGCVKIDSANVTQPPGIALSISTTNVTCGSGANGAINLHASYGSSPYSFLWNDGSTAEDRSGIASGTYSVTVTDEAGCKATTSATVGQSGSGMAINTGTTPPTCFGGANGAINVTSVVGSIGPYTFKWSHGPTAQSATGLSAGAYSVTATSTTGCTASASVNISQPAAMSATLNMANVSCYGGSNGAINALVSSGSTPYTFLWNDGVATKNRTGLNSGTYSLTATDARGCTVSASVFVPQPPAFSATAIASPLSCSGGPTGALSAAATGGTPPLTYWWGGGVTTPNRLNVGPGTYAVTVTDANGCTAAASTFIAPYTPLSAVTTTAPVSCLNGNNGSVNLSVFNGRAPYQFIWSNAASAEDISGLSAGTYTVTVTDDRNCTASAAATVSQPTLPITINATVNGVTCHGGSNGSINVNAIIGNPPYSYVWNGGINTPSRTNLSAGTYAVTVTDNSGCTASTAVAVNQPAALLVSATATNETCHGASDGSVLIAPYGGVAPFSYQWSNGATTQNLIHIPESSYSVTITDNVSCTATATATVTKAAAIVVLATPSHVRCNGGNNGAIVLSVTGGTGALTYDWGGGITTQNRTSLTAGSYSVTITDNAGCTATSTTGISQPGAISITPMSTDATCYSGNNGSIAISVSGGSGVYHFDWGGGINTQNRTNLYAGNYTVTVTDNAGCTGTATASVTQPAAALTVATAVQNATCHGAQNGSATLNVTGGTGPYTYAWSNSDTHHTISGIGAGKYDVAVTDAHGCSATAEAAVSEPSDLAVHINKQDVICSGGATGAISLTVHGGVPPYSYNWSNGAATPSLFSLVANTHSVTVTDFHACTAAATAVITQPTQITTILTVQDVPCNGGNSGAIHVTVSGGSGAYSYQWNNTVTTQNISNLTAGLFTVTITDDNNCQTTASVSVNQPAPIQLIASVQHTGCNGGAIDLTATGGTGAHQYIWSNGAHTPSISGVTAGSYGVTVNDQNACQASQSFTIAPQIPLSGAITKTDVSCFGAADGSATLTINGGIGPYSFLWHDGSQQQNRSGLHGGVCSVTITDAGNCTFTVNTPINEPDAISIAVSKIDVPCSGAHNGSVALTASGGTGSYHYNWDIPSTAAAANNLAAGNYNCTVTDGNNCSATQSIQIVQPDALSISAAVTHVSCAGLNNGNIIATAHGGSGNFIYQWSNGAGNASVHNLGPGIVGLTVTDAANCSTTFSTVISEPTALALNATSVPFACANFPGSIDLNVSGGTAPYNYAWNNQAASQDIANLQAGSYSVTVTDHQNCAQSLTAVVSAIPAMNATTVAHDATCHGSATGSITLHVTGGTAPYSYLWSKGITTQHLNEIPAGIYTVAVTDQANCATSQSDTVNEPEALTVHAIKTDITCFGANNGSIDLSVSGGAGNYSFSWNNGGNTEDISGLNSGTYSVIVTDADNCNASTGAISIKEPALLSVNSSVLAVGCGGTDNGGVTIQTSGGTAPYYYYWNNGANTANLTQAGAGIYSLTVTDAKGCSATTLAEVPTATPITLRGNVQQTACDQAATGSIQLDVAGGTPGYVFNWSNGSTDQNIVDLPAGDYSVVVTDNQNCTMQTSFNVSAAYILSVDATPSTTINPGESIVLDAVPNVNNGNTFSWTPTQQLGCSNCQTTEATPTTETHYTVVVTDQYGCTATDTLTVRINSITDVFIPNAFTPNQDGNNDVLKLYGDVAAIQYLDFMVFNRWGEVVFATNDHNFQWDGTYKGQVVDRGVYVYAMKAVFTNGYSRNDYKGSVTVIR